jgi:uncharacterized membrane protein
MNSARIQLVLVLAAALGCGLLGGVFFGFSTFVMKGLARLPAAAGIAAMQSINVAVYPSLFLVVFFAVPALTLILMIASLWQWDRPGSAYLLAGGLVYLIGSFGVTAMFNVPLNNLIALIAPGQADEADLWLGYCRSWMLWNHLRTVASFVACALFTLSLLP